MSERSAYACQIQVIQGCHAVLIFCGLAAAGLAGSQFSRVGLFNYRDIDLRLLNWIHALTGAVGIYALLKNHGSIVAKTLYYVSLVIGIATAVFYGFTTYRVVDAHRNLQSLQGAAGFQEGFGQESQNYAGRVVISAIMIGIPALAALVALIALFLIDKIVVSPVPVYTLQSRDQEMAMESAKNTLASVGIIKFVFGLGVLGLAVFVEYEHEKVAGSDKYIKIALEHISAMLAIASAAVDLQAIKIRRMEQLNLKVALGLAVIAATWCLKSVDHDMMPFYKNDLKYYYRGRELGDPSITSNSSPRYIIVIAHGVLIGCYGILFFLCCFSSVVVGTYLQLDYLSMNMRVAKGVQIQSRLLSVLHLLWSACMMALCILGLLDTQWRGEFLGADLLWLSVLFATTGVLGSSNYGAHINTRFVLNTVCLGISIEKMCASINLIYQYSSYDIYVNGNRRTFIGQIVLISCQTGVLAAEALTALASAVIFGKEISKQNTGSYRYNTVVHMIFSLGTLFYAVVITGCYVVFELGKWRYSEVPIEVPFYRLGNGPLAAAVFIVQLCCMCHPQLLAASTILHTIVAAIALFTISPAITNVYYLQVLLDSTAVLQTTSTQETIYKVAIILAAGAALACFIATLCGAVCVLRSSYILHHYDVSPESTVVAPLGDEQYGSGTLQRMTQSPMTATTTQQSPVSQMAIQPMEEQTVYWSADENPFYYHTSKRFYGQPYQIDSGFYGYQLSNPAPPGVHHHRRVQSSAVQTQIGHVFHEGSR